MKASKLEFWRAGTSLLLGTSGFSLTLGKWHHISVTRSGVNLYMSLDGTTSLISSSLSGSIGTDGTSQLGNNSNALGGQCDLSHFAWHTSAKYTTNFTPALPTGAARYWPLTETSGTTATDVVAGKDGTYTGSGTQKIEWPFGESAVIVVED